MSKFNQWQVLSRPDCSLCDKLLSELCELVGAEAAAHIQVVDISSDPELERRYVQRIPVLMIDGEMVCCYRLDRERVQAHLS